MSGLFWEFLRRQPCKHCQANQIGVVDAGPLGLPKNHVCSDEDYANSDPSDVIVVPAAANIKPALKAPPKATPLPPAAIKSAVKTHPKQNSFPQIALKIQNPTKPQAVTIITPSRPHQNAQIGNFPKVEILPKVESFPKVPTTKAAVPTNSNQNFNPYVESKVGVAPTPHPDRNVYLPSGTKVGSTAIAPAIKIVAEPYPYHELQLQNEMKVKSAANATPRKTAAPIHPYQNDYPTSMMTIEEEETPQRAQTEESYIQVQPDRRLYPQIDDDPYVYPVSQVKNVAKIYPNQDNYPRSVARVSELSAFRRVPETKSAARRHQSQGSPQSVTKVDEKTAYEYDNIRAKGMPICLDCFMI